MLDNCIVSSYNFDMDCAFLCCNKIREVFRVLFLSLFYISVEKFMDTVMDTRNTNEIADNSSRGFRKGARFWNCNILGFRVRITVRLDIVSVIL
jgi:hypothetical protein